MQATEYSIEKLVKNTSLAINNLYPSLKRDIVVANECKGKVSPLLELVPEMRMNVKFILVDLATASHALLSVRSAIEKRLHLINLRVESQAGGLSYPERGGGRRSQSTEITESFASASLRYCFLKRRFFGLVWQE
jgi:hypothetical protein